MIPIRVRADCLLVVVAAPKTVAASPTVAAGRVVGTRARRGGADQLADGSAFSVAQEALGAAIGGLPRRLAQARRLPEASSFAVLQDAAECVTRRGIPARDAPLLLYCPLRPGHAASAASLSRRLASQRSKYAPSGGQYRAADEQVDDRNSHELHRVQAEISWYQASTSTMVHLIPVAAVCPGLGSQLPH